MSKGPVCTINTRVLRLNKNVRRLKQRVYKCEMFVNKIKNEKIKNKYLE